MEVYQDDVIKEGQNDEIIHLKLELEKTLALNKKYKEELAKKDEAINELKYEYQTQLSQANGEKMQAEETCKQMEIRLQEFELSSSFHREICDLLGITDIKDATHKIEALHNQISELQVAVSTAQVFGKANQEFSLQENDEKLKEIQDDFSNQLQKTIKTYEEQLTEEKLQIKRKENEMFEMQQQMKEMQFSLEQMKKKNEEYEQIKNEALQQYETASVEYYQLSQERDELQKEIQNKDLQIQAIEDKMNLAEQHSSVYQSTFNDIIQALNQYHAQNPRSAVTVCDSLYKIFLELTSNPNHVPDINELISSLSTVPTPGFTESNAREFVQLINDYNTHWGDLFNDMKEECYKRLETLDNQISSIKSKISEQFSEIIQNLIEEKESIMEDLRYLEENDMAPLAQSLQAQLNELKRR